MKKSLIVFCILFLCGTSWACIGCRNYGRMVEIKERYDKACYELKYFEKRFFSDEYKDLLEKEKLLLEKMAYWVEVSGINYGKFLMWEDTEKETENTRKFGREMYEKYKETKCVRKNASASK